MFFLGYTLAIVHYGQNVKYIRMMTEHDDTGVQTGAAREDKGTQTSLSNNVERWRLAYERVQEENRALRNRVATCEGSVTAHGRVWHPDPQCGHIRGRDRRTYRVCIDCVGRVIDG